LRRLLLLLSLMLVCAVAAPARAATAYSGDRMMDAVNWVRAQAGLRPLRQSQRLIRSSAARAGVMMRDDFFAHPQRLRVPTFERVGEVLELHSGRRARVNRTLRRWANSPAHREVITARHFRWIGAARATGRFRGQRATIWVVRFGRR
jgi:uncharacterized protein YkwD